MEPIKPQNCKNFFLTQWVMKWETCFLILPVIKIFKHNFKQNKTRNLSDQKHQNDEENQFI